VTEGSFDAYMWQTLETKACFIQQVMNGHTSVRAAEDLDGGALTYAEIKAIASGNPAVMEKVRIDTEVRKLDQLRAAHLNQQHSIRLQIRSLPSEIKDRQERIKRLSADAATRDGHKPAPAEAGGDEFSMKVGNRVFSGKGAREEGAAALTQAVLSWRDDMTLQVRGAFRGFEILSRRRGATLLAGSDDERLPEPFIRGAGIYKAQLNAENPVGTMQSIEYALRGLDKAGVDERERAARAEKMLGDFQEQAGKPFEHEARLKELLGRQAELNAALDLDKGERQIAPPAGANVHAVDDLAMWLAAKNGHADTVKALLDGGANVHTDEDAALRLAAGGGHTETVKALLAAGADVHGEQDAALRKASANGHTDTVRVLLEAGAHVRAKEDWALQWAVKNGHTDTVRLLNEWMAREVKKPAEGSETT